MNSKYSLYYLNTFRVEGNIKSFFGCTARNEIQRQGHFDVSIIPRTKLALNDLLQSESQEHSTSYIIPYSSLVLANLISFLSAFILYSLKILFRDFLLRKWSCVLFKK